MSLKITQAECIKTERLELKSYRSSDKEQLIDLLTNEEITKTGARVQIKGAYTEPD